MSRRSRGRPSPSRGARVERRKADRSGPRTMSIPDAIAALGPARGERTPVPTDTRCTPCRSVGCLERRDIATGECMALKLGREIIAESGGGRAGTIPHRRAAVKQLDLFSQLSGATGSQPSGGAS